MHLPNHIFKSKMFRTALQMWALFNTLRLRQNGRLFADDTFKRIFLNKNIRISIEISLNFVPKGPINNIPALVQIMAWRRSGGKPLSEPMMVILLTHICVTRPQWVKCLLLFYIIKHHSASTTGTSFATRAGVESTVKPVYNDHLMGYFSAFWSSSRWPSQGPPRWAPEGRNC